MGVLLSHIGLDPIIYGFVIAIGIMVMYVKLIKRAWFSLLVDIGVFTLVFVLHGGTLKGGLAAAMAAMICGIAFPLVSAVWRPK